MVVMSWPLLIAAGLMAAITLLHIFGGGREAARPLVADSNLPKNAKMTLFYAWHLVTIALAFMAFVFLAAALRPEFVAIAWAFGWLTALFATFSVLQTLVMRLPFSMLPQWVLFAPVAALVLWGTTQ